MESLSQKDRSLLRTQERLCALAIWQKKLAWDGLFAYLEKRSLSKKVHPRVRIGSRLPALGWVATGVSYNLCNNFYCHDLWPYIDDSHCTLVPFHYGRHHSSCVNSARMSDITRTHLLPSTDQLILFIDLCAHLQPLIEYVASLRMLYHQLGT